MLAEGIWIWLLKKIKNPTPGASDWSDFVYFGCYVQIQVPIILSWNFPLNLGPLIGCLGAHASPHPWTLQLLLGSSTFQTYCALCAKIHIFQV